MEEKIADVEVETTSVVKLDGMTLDETQFAEQLYNSAGLDPIIDAGMKDYDKKLQQENKLINKVFGIRDSDVRGYSEAVAKRVAFAVYNVLSKQYGGKVGDLRKYMLSLEDDRDRANIRYDELMGRVIGILGDEYKNLRTDSKEFIEKLTKTLGDDLKDSKIDQKALAESLADIDGLRAQITAIEKEKEQLKEKHEAQIVALKGEHKEEIGNLNAQIDTLGKEKEQLKENHAAQIATLSSEHKEEIKNLNSQIVTLGKEKEQLKEKQEAQITALSSEHKEEIRNLNAKLDTSTKEKEQLKEKHEAQITELNTRISGLESDKTSLTNDLKQLKTDYKKLKTALSTLAETTPNEGMAEKHGEDQYKYLLKDSKVPSAVLKGVDQFIDFKKYLGLAAESGAREVRVRIETILATTRNE